MIWRNAMKSKGNLINLYKALFPSRELASNRESIDDFLKYAKEKKIDAFDGRVVDKYINDPQFLEKKMIQYITRSNDIKINMDYLALYSQQMNAASISDEENAIIFVDELLEYTMLSFYLTIYSLANDRSPENFEWCIKNCIVLLDLQGNKHEIGTHNRKNLMEMSMIPTNTMHLAMDTYWTTWVFIICHELFHLVNQKTMSAYQEELEADTYGYRILMHLIIDQKEGKLPEELQVFYEYLYLSPIMLMEYYRLLDFYQELCGQKIIYENHPSPEERQEHIFDLYETCVPECIDTKTGNELLNIFLDMVELLKEQIQIKKEQKKL